GARGRGWDGPLGPQPERLRGGSDSELIAGLDRVWDVPARPLAEAVIDHTRHDSPLVRYAACRTLSRVGDSTAGEPLLERLGAASKVVQRAAAEALRAVGSRSSADRPPGGSAEQALVVAALTRALESTDDRVRRGAARVFAAHFRDLSQETGLADVLLGRLDDRDAV